MTPNEDLCPYCDSSDTEPVVLPTGRYAMVCNRCNGIWRPTPPPKPGGTS